MIYWRVGPVVRTRLKAAGHFLGEAVKFSPNKSIVKVERDGNGSRNAVSRVFAFPACLVSAAIIFLIFDQGIYSLREAEAFMSLASVFITGTF